MPAKYLFKVSTRKGFSHSGAGSASFRASCQVQLQWLDHFIKAFGFVAQSALAASSFPRNPLAWLWQFFFVHKLEHHTKIKDKQGKESYLKLSPFNVLCFSSCALLLEPSFFCAFYSHFLLAATVGKIFALCQEFWLFAVSLYIVKYVYVYKYIL